MSLSLTLCSIMAAVGVGPAPFGGDYGMPVHFGRFAGDD